MEFEIISGDDQLIKEVVKKYNEIYNTDFKILDFTYDEVIFCKLTVTRFNTKDIFDLGYQLGSYAQFKRNNGEIDW